uniref:tail fiber domain-containing protein n=1 Tax=Dyadobacter sp. TaxID=1914288 RepID=UPI003F729B2D
EGNMSLSAGEGTFAKAFASATFGAYNNVQDNPSGPAITDAKGSDRLFQIGNGSGPAALSNAFTVLRNGRIGIGNGSIVPQFILDIDGRPRIRHGAETAGIYFDNSAHEPKSFVGMKTDEQIGFYLGNDWRFWVNATGGATLVGALQEVSDVRLKRDFSPLQNSLTKLSQLSGYHYFWKNKNLSQTTQTGLIAQEVEKLFPELVKTDEKGFKTVNYTGLIPHLIEALKELDTKNKELDNALSRLNHLEASVNELLKKEKIDTHDQKEVR